MNTQETNQDDGIVDDMEDGDLFEDGIEGFDMRIHIGIHHDPVQVVMIVRIGIGRKVQFRPPALDKAAPEKLPDRDTVRLFMPGGFP